MAKQGKAKFKLWHLGLMLVGGLAGIAAIEGLRAAGILAQSEAPSPRHDWLLALGALIGCVPLAFIFWRR